jgi:hypothetical protein
MSVTLRPRAAIRPAFVGEEQECSSGSERAGAHVEGLIDVLDVFEHVESGDRVKRSGRVEFFGERDPIVDP